MWIGTAVGMVVADAPAIGVGTLLHRRLPERLLHALANPLDNALGRRSVAIAVTAVVAVGAATIATTATAQTRRRRRADTPSPTIPPGST
ncbi:hypothetical protein MSAS_32880 [Mycobacterium saskatchewanense]|nr:hypothetical protein MSAS_32880 [Mycobacterium saskatchewanense]